MINPTAAYAFALVACTLNYIVNPRIVLIGRKRRRFVLRPESAPIPLVILFETWNHALLLIVAHMSNPLTVLVAEGPARIPPCADKTLVACRVHFSEWGDAVVLVPAKLDPVTWHCSKMLS
jgi:hypothetical protein